MRYIPTEAQLKDSVKLVEVTVFGEYIARIDERRKTSKRYEVKVNVPENFNKSDLKRATPKVLATHKDFGDFISMRTFTQEGAAKKTDKTIKRRDLYSIRELDRFKKLREEIAREKKRERAERAKYGDTSEYDDETGLPPVVNE